jgi:nucleoside-diphosphate-sugar epimerase
MKKGKPVVVHGDGTSIWTLTHHRDFAKGLVGLLGNQKALNEIFHITSDEWLPWNQIHEMVGDAFGVTPKIVHVPSEVIAHYDEFIGSSLWGDKSHSMIFDNSKIKSIVPDFKCEIPFSVGVKEIAAWYEADISRQKVDLKYDKMFDQIIQDYFG